MPYIPETPAGVPGEEKEQQKRPRNSNFDGGQWEFV